MISLEIMGVLVFIINQEFSISWNHQEFFIDETMIVFYEARTRLPVPVPHLSSFFIYLFLFMDLHRFELICAEPGQFG